MLSRRTLDAFLRGQGPIAGVESLAEPGAEAGARDVVVDPEVPVQVPTAILRRALNLGTLSKPTKVINPPKNPRLKEDPPRKGFFEYDEFLALRCELPAQLRAPITFAFYTAAEKGKCSRCRLTRSTSASG